MRDPDLAVGWVRWLRPQYATLTGTIAIRWEGARAPHVWIVPPPTIDAAEGDARACAPLPARLRSVDRRGVRQWAGIGRQSRPGFAELDRTSPPCESPSTWLACSPPTRQRCASPPRSRRRLRLLPSGDAYTAPTTAHERALLVPNEKQRNELWTPRVWPGALLVDGEIVGTWRRAKRVLTIDAWKKLSGAARDAVVAEADTLPLPDPGEGMAVHWN